MTRAIRNEQTFLRTNRPTISSIGHGYLNSLNPCWHSSGMKLAEKMGYRIIRECMHYIIFILILSCSLTSYSYNLRVQKTRGS